MPFSKTGIFITIGFWHSNFVSLAAEEQITMLNVNLETVQKDLEEAQTNLDREKAKVSSINETLSNQSDSNIEKISTLEKYLSERDDIILEHEHKIEQLKSYLEKNSEIFNKVRIKGFSSCI